MSTLSQVEPWLDDLASAAPTPGGGAAAAMSAAMAAALVSMVCNLTIGKPGFEGVSSTLEEIRGAAEVARRRALTLVDADAAAFQAVLAAWRLPGQSPAERAARKVTIGDALVQAATVPLETARLCVHLVDLAGALVEICNPNVVSDVAVSAQAAKMAIEASMVNVDVNLVALKSAERKAPLASGIAACAPALAAADAVVAGVRRRMGA